MEGKKPTGQRLKFNLRLSKVQIAIIAVVTAFVVLVAVFSCLASAYNKTFSGVSVCGIDIGKTDVNSATAVLEKSFSEKSPEITVNISGQQIVFSLDDIGNYDFTATAQKAHNHGKRNFFTRLYTYLTPFVKRDLTMEFYINESRVAELLNAENLKLDTFYKDTTYVIDEDTLIITSGCAGNTVDAAKIIEQIKTAVASGDNVTIDAEIIHKGYSGIDIDKIYNEVVQAPENAYYDEANSKIVPHKTGYDFDKEAARELTKDAPENTSYTVQLSVTYPEITEAKLSGKMFEDVLASYTTTYNTAEVDRTHNMILAGQMVHGTVLAPGEVFSYNNVVGERTVAKGYRNAKVFEGGRVVDGLAGGICQVSSTIYNAALYSNMEIVERENHSFPVAYTPKGQDATVVMGVIDFKFKNTMKNPIQVTCSINGGKCTVSILGIKEKNYDVQINNVITGSTPYKTEYVNDESLEPGKEVVKQNGSYGYSVKSTRSVYENGQLVKTESIPSSYYIPLSKIVARNETAMEEQEDEPVSNPEDVPSAETPAGNEIPDPEPPSEDATAPEPEITSPELGLETEIYS